MRNWSDFLDLNLLRPSAFERRHIEVQRHQPAHQRHSSTSSLPQNLPSRFASFTTPVSYNLDPASPLNALHHHQPRQSLDGRRRNASGASLSTPSQQQQQPSSQTHHSSFFSTRFRTPPASSGDESTASRFSLTGAQGRRSREASMDAASNTSTGEDASSRRSFLRPFFNRNSSWNGQSPSSATPSSISGTITRTQSNASRTTSAGASRPGGQDTSNEDGNESEEDRQRQHRPIKFLARPPTGIDMTPRTDRMRRRTHVDDEDLVGTAGAAGGAAAEGTTEVIVSVPLTIADIPAETSPADGMSEGTVEGAGGATAEARDHQAESTTTQAATAAILGHSISRTSTASPTSASNRSTSVPPTSVLQQPSLNESRTLTLQESNGLIFQRQPTPEERRIQRQLKYMKKFMCVIATMPIIATLAVYNKLELIMWWIIALPLVGIVMALVWRRRLAVKLQRLQEATDLARLSLAFAPTQSSTTRVLRQNQDNDDGPPPPPDYQSSIITPPAYIVAQQPRKVPSYRSLENLFAFARNGSRIFSRGTAAAAAEANTTTESGAGEEGEGEGQHEEGEANRGENHTAETETQHQEDASNSRRNHGVSVIIQMPQDSVEAPQESEQTIQHYLEHKTEESAMAQEKTDVTTATTTTTTTASTPLTAITVVPRVEIEFVQPQAYLPPSMPEMVEVGTGLGSHPTHHQHLHHYQGTRSFVSTTSSSCGSSSTAHDTHDLTLVDSFDGELQRDRRHSLRTITSLEGDWETDQDTQSAESSSLAHARHRSRDIKGKAPSRE